MDYHLQANSSSRPPVGYPSLISANDWQHKRTMTIGLVGRYYRFFFTSSTSSLFAYLVDRRWKHIGNPKFILPPITDYWENTTVTVYVPSFIERLLMPQDQEDWQNMTGRGYPFCLHAFYIPLARKILTNWKFYIKPIYRRGVPRPLLTTSYTSLDPDIEVCKQRRRASTAIEFRMAGWLDSPVSPH